MHCFLALSNVCKAIGFERSYMGSIKICLCLVLFKQLYGSTLHQKLLIALALGEIYTHIHTDVRKETILRN